MPLELHIATTGDDRNPGTQPRPLATLQAARDRLRAARRDGTLPSDGAVVTLHAGTYRQDRTFELTAEDSGTTEAPLVIQAAAGEEVRISGGRCLDPKAWTPVSDPGILERIDPAAHGKLLQVNLARQGVTGIGPVQSRGFGFSPYKVPSEIELFFNDQPMPLPRWPREGFMLTGPVIDSGTNHNVPVPRGATFTCLDERLKRWGNARDALCFGYWFADWAPSTQSAASFDPETMQVTFGGTSTYGVKEGQRFFVFNLLEELANPGEWHIDRQAGMLYFWPPDDVAGARIAVSVLEQPLVALNETVHVTLEGLIFECTRGTGAVIDGGTGNRLSGCTFRNIGQEAARIGGTGNGAENCHVYQTGQGGFHLEGGDRRMLTPGNNFVRNNHIHHFNRVCQAYMPGIGLSGVGHHVAHNRVHDAPHCALSFFDYEKAFGNDHLIEYNEFYDVALEADDTAAIYFARNVSERGTIIRHNFFHHIGSPLNWGSSGIYPDDGGGAVEIYGNVFYRVGNRGQVGMGAVFVNGGKDVVIDNNVFVECPQAVGVLLWPQAEWDRFLSKTDPKFPWVPKLIYEDVDITKPPYTTRYPELANLALNASRNTVRRNLVCRCGSLGMSLDRQDMRDNWLTEDDSGFEDASRMKFGLRHDAPVFDHIPGFKPIPFEKIGLQFRMGDSIAPRSRVEASFPGVQQLAIPMNQESAVSRLVLRVANGCVARKEGAFSLTCNPPGAVRFPGETELRYALDPGETMDHAMDMEVTPPKGRHEIYVVAHDNNTAYAAFLQLEVQYHHTVPRLGAIEALAQVKSALAAVEAMSVTTGSTPAAVVRMAPAGEFLAVHATVCDHRTTSEAGSWQGAGNIWSEPLFGLFADSIESEIIRQLVFFPDGSGTGEIWGFSGTQRTPVPEIQWQATARTECGYELAALVPLSALGLTPQTRQFRMQAMMCIKPSPAANGAVLPLVGSTVSYHNSNRFCILSVKGANP